MNPKEKISKLEIATIIVFMAVASFMCYYGIKQSPHCFNEFQRNRSIFEQCQKLGYNYMVLTDECVRAKKIVEQGPIFCTIEKVAMHFSPTNFILNLIKTPKPNVEDKHDFLEDYCKDTPDNAKWQTCPSICRYKYVPS